MRVHLRACWSVVRGVGDRRVGGSNRDSFKGVRLGNRPSGRWLGAFAPGI